MIGNPLSNPIIGREFVGLLRSRRVLAVEFVLAATLAALVLLRWPDDALVDVSGEQARRVLQLFGYGLLAAIVCFAPLFPAASVVRERRSGTLALLLNAPLSPLQIILGKLAGSLGLVALLLTLSAPAAAACYVMGGVDLSGELLPLYGVLAALALQLAALGLYVSTRSATVDGAIRVTYLLVLGLTLLPLAPYRFLGGLVGPAWASALEWFHDLSPVPAAMGLLGQTGLGGSGLAVSGSPAARFALLACATALALLALTRRRLNQTMLDRPRPAGRVTDERSGAARAYRRIMYLWFFDPQRRTGLIWTSPVLVKELRSSRLGRRHWLMRLLGGCVLVSLGLMIAATRVSTSWGASTLGGLVVLLQFALILLLTPALAAGLLANEREGRTWQLLQLTPLRVPWIVAGKLAAVLLMLVLVLLSTLPSYGIIMLIDTDLLAATVRVLITLGLTALFAMLVSAGIGSFFAQSTGATVAAFVVLLSLVSGTLLIWLGEGTPFSHTLAERALLLNPLAAALAAMRAGGFERYQLLPGNWVFLAIGSAASLALLGFNTWRLSRPR